MEVMAVIVGSDVLRELMVFGSGNNEANFHQEFAYKHLPVPGVTWVLWFLGAVWCPDIFNLSGSAEKLGMGNG